MKLILIFPDFEIWSHLDVNWLQFGLAHLYTETKASGFNVEYWDGRLMKFEEMCKKIELDKDITHIGINVMSCYRDNARNLFSFIKEKRPEVLKISGGVHTSNLPEEFDNLCDFIIIGEGEKVLVQIMKGELEKGRINGRIENLDELLYVDRDMLPLEETPINPNLPRPFVTIMNSRACPYSCTFCAPASKNVFGNKFKARSLEHLMGEIKELVAIKGIKSFHMNDDNFLVKPEYVSAFCKAIKPFNLVWSFQGRADAICRHPKMIEEMANAGAKLCLVGFESGSDRVLKFLNKGTTREQNIKCCHILHDFDIMVWSNLIFGIPTEQPSEVLETITFVEQGSPDLLSICCYTPYPGSYLYDYCKENKLMPENPDQSYWNRGAFEPKIKGVDYAFLAWASQKMCEIAYHGGKL